MASSSSLVIGICGIVSAGKTSLIKDVAKSLQDSVSMLWDDYDHLVKLEFEDPKKWVKDGCDTNRWKTEQFIEDLRSLKDGKQILHPITKEKINPARYIFVEDPTGRTRNEMKTLVDYLIFIDLPHEISLARTYNRELNNMQKLQNPEELVNLLKFYTQRYLDWFHSALKIIEERIREDADLIVDGLKPITELAELVTSKIGEY
ncbi:MAG: hypothetical protein HGN29_08425 [Asgard group archaeon]|nr:hypothetical protein [Asgard group archaeon]